MIDITVSGSTKGTEEFLRRAAKMNPLQDLHRFGRDGVAALSAATPVESGATSAMWDYEVAKTKDGYRLSWVNRNLVAGIPVVILLQYGHGTGTGGYVQGRDFINPALRPIYNQIADSMWKVVKG